MHLKVFLRVFAFKFTCVVVKTSDEVIAPNHLLGCWGGLVCTFSCHWARSEVDPGQVSSPSQGDTETHSIARTLTPKDNLEQHLTLMFLDCERKLE
ncbi:hypothetical protein AMECASPLE_032068 [Ameca splendens]|uniref:Secreted protein n=1 Tax=Ameca splendens TaxID=208324 RepID=A0ABV1ACV4_9TELE